MSSLRDQIAEALTRWTLEVVRGVPDVTAADVAKFNFAENSLARADAVMAVVQPVLDAKDAEIERLTDYYWKQTKALHAERDGALSRAWQATQALGRALGLIHRDRGRAALMARDLAEAAHHRDGYERECDLWAENSGKLLEKIEQAEAERDRYREAIERVRAYCTTPPEPHPTHDHLCPDDVLAALAQPAATPTEDA